MTFLRGLDDAAPIGECELCRVGGRDEHVMLGIMDGVKGRGLAAAAAAEIQQLPLAVTPRVKYPSDLDAISTSMSIV